MAWKTQQASLASECWLGRWAAIPTLLRKEKTGTGLLFLAGHVKVD